MRFYNIDTLEHMNFNELKKELGWLRVGEEMHVRKVEE